MSEHVSQTNRVLSYPKGGKPAIITNEWQVWDAQEQGKLPDLENSKNKVLVPFTWWCAQMDSSQNEADLLAKAKNGQIGVWFAADDDILKHEELINAGKQYWPLVAAYFPLFRDGRSFSTAALLRERFHWTGEIRAIGDVLIDQLILGARSGFDSFALRADQNTDVALKQFNLFTVTTQNSWRDCRSQLSNQLTEAV